VFNFFFQVCSPTQLGIVYFHESNIKVYEDEEKNVEIIFQEESFFFWEKKVNLPAKCKHIKLKSIYKQLCTS
jgi:hypothetical protein